MSTKHQATFTHNAIIIGEQTFPAGYSIDDNGTVTVYTYANDGQHNSRRMTITIDQANENYPAALKAAEQYLADMDDARETLKQMHEQADAKAAEPQPEDSAPEATAEPLKESVQAIIDEFTFAPEIAAQPEPAAQLAERRPAKPAPVAADTKPCVPKPRKDFVGMEIKGKGWTIYFDGEHERTRVIFKRKPGDSVREAVKSAGFYWSPVLKSWNKKLTNKAFMAAQTLAIDLRKLCA